MQNITNEPIDIDLRQINIEVDYAKYILSITSHMATGKLNMVCEVKCVNFREELTIVKNIRRRLSWRIGANEQYDLLRPYSRELLYG